MRDRLPVLGAEGMAGSVRLGVMEQVKQELAAGLGEECGMGAGGRVM